MPRPWLYSNELILVILCKHRNTLTANTPCYLIFDCFKINFKRLCYEITWWNNIYIVHFPGALILLYNGYRVSFKWVTRPGHGVWHLLPSTAPVNERIGLYLYSPTGPSRVNFILNPKHIYFNDKNSGYDNKLIANVSNAKFLGIVMDNTLSWRIHIEHWTQIKCSLSCNGICQAKYVTGNTEDCLLFLFAFHYELQISILGELFVQCRTFGIQRI
jgi:hypothetical protein